MALGAELAHAQSTAADAEKLDAVAQDKWTAAKVSAQDEVDASHLFTEAAKETKEVQMLVNAVKKEQAQKVMAVNFECLGKLIEQKKDLLVVCAP